MITIAQFCTSLLIQMPVVLTISPETTYQRCTFYYTTCTTQRLLDELRASVQPVSTLEADIAQCAAARTEKDY